MIITINASVLRCTIVEIVIVILFVAFVILQLLLWDFKSLMQKDINRQNVQNIVIVVIAFLQNKNFYKYPQFSNNTVTYNILENGEMG